jgi:hypothetical protein
MLPVPTMLAGEGLLLIERCPFLRVQSGSDTGNYFHADWLRPYSTMPDRATLRVYGASDYAVPADGGDYTDRGTIWLPLTR